MIDPLDIYYETRDLNNKAQAKNTVGMADSAVALLEIIQPHMTPEERMELWRRIKLNYCGECGVSLPKGARCYCEHED